LITASSLNLNAVFFCGTGGDMSSDQRVQHLHWVLSMGAEDIVPYFYPRLLPLHEVQPNDAALPGLLCFSSFDFSAPVLDLTPPAMFSWHIFIRASSDFSGFSPPPFASIQSRCRAARVRCRTTAST
jgi:hypothetical protein